MRQPRRRTLGAVVVVLLALLALLPAVPAVAETTLILDPSWGPTGQRVLVTGEEYFPDSEVRVYFDTTTANGSDRVAITTADSTGSMSTNFVVPGALAGDKTVLACSVFSGEDRCAPAVNGTDPVARATFTHLGRPSISLDPRWAQAGSTVTVTGERFSSKGCGDVEVVFDFGGEGEEVVATPTLFSGGPGTAASFSAEFAVPDRPADSYAVVARQTSTGCRITPRAFLDVLEFEVTPDTGAAGSTATAIGAGFPDSEECGLTVIRFDGEAVAQATTVGFPGEEFRVEFIVPDRPPATYVVEATQDGCGDRRATDTFTIPRAPTPTPTEPPRPDATLAIDPTEGPIETEATAEGTGFDDGVLVEIRFGDVDASTVPPGDVTDGGFTAPVVVPEGVPGGPTTVTACQRCGTADERVATAPFEVTPRLFVEPEVGPPGFVTLARGDGWPAATAVMLDWEPGIGATIATTNDSGILRTPVLVFHRDRLGVRALAAFLAGDDAPAATAPFTVVPGSAQPRGFTFRR